jgi:hypothetical protein
MSPAARRVAAGRPVVEVVAGAPPTVVRASGAGVGEPPPDPPQATMTKASRRAARRMGDSFPDLTAGKDAPVVAG